MIDCRDALKITEQSLAGGELLPVQESYEYMFTVRLALEKQTPKKPETSYDGYADGNPVWDYFCPCCHRDFEDNMPTFCEDCGQALDWSEENDL